MFWRLRTPSRRFERQLPPEIRLIVFVVLRFCFVCRDCAARFRVGGADRSKLSQATGFQVGQTGGGGCISLPVCACLASGGPEGKPCSELVTVLIHQCGRCTSKWLPSARRCFESLEADKMVLDHFRVSRFWLADAALGRASWFSCSRCSRCAQLMYSVLCPRGSPQANALAERASSLSIAPEGRRVLKIGYVALARISRWSIIAPRTGVRLRKAVKILFCWR